MLVGKIGRMNNRKMQMRGMLKENTTGVAVAGIGLLVVALGRFLGGRMGDTLSGFGIAHLLLGILDMLRDE